MVVDTAIETGGNVECSRYDEELEVNGVRGYCFRQSACRAAANASEMYSNNLCAFVEHFWEKEAKAFRLDRTNEILKACVITHAGEICSEIIRAIY